MKINFFNESKFDTEIYEKILKKVFKKIKNKNKFNIIFVDGEYIKKLNNDYRNIDSVTDVLSFALRDDPNNNILNELGDVFICLERALSQAKDYGHTDIREVAFLAVHGYLHLCGYDHMTKQDEEIMFNLQEDILSKSNIRRFKTVELKLN